MDTGHLSCTTFCLVLLASACGLSRASGRRRAHSSGARASACSGSTAPAGADHSALGRAAQPSAALPRCARAPPACSPRPRRLLASRALALTATFAWVSGAAAGEYAVLFKTFDPSPVMRARLCEAAREMDIHVQIYVATGQNVSQRPDLCGAVSILTPPDVASLWGEEVAEALDSRRWELNGLTEMAFFDLHMRRNASLDGIWVVETDVGWTGSLRSILDSFSNETHDFLCFDPSEVHYMRRHFWERQNKWMHARTHSGVFFQNEPGDHRVRCQIFVTRYSRRLLERLSDDYIANGAWAHPEWLAATVCGLHLPGCVVGDLQKLRPQLIGHQFMYWTPPGHEVINATVWARIQAESGGVPKLYHPLKF